METTKGLNDWLNEVTHSISAKVILGMFGMGLSFGLSYGAARIGGEVAVATNSLKIVAMQHDIEEMEKELPRLVSSIAVSEARFEEINRRLTRIETYIESQTTVRR